MAPTNFIVAPREEISRRWITVLMSAGRGGGLCLTCFCIIKEALGHPFISYWKRHYGALCAAFFWEAPLLDFAPEVVLQNQTVSCHFWAIKNVSAVQKEKLPPCYFETCINALMKVYLAMVVTHDKLNIPLSSLKIYAAATTYSLSHYLWLYQVFSCNSKICLYFFRKYTGIQL